MRRGRNGGGTAESLSTYPRLQLTARSIAIAALVVAGVLLGAWVLSRSTRVLGWLAAAIAVAALLQPIVEALAARVGRGVAVALVLVATLGLVGAVVAASVGDLGRGLDRLRSAAPEAAEDVENSESWIGDAARDFGLRERVESFLDDLPARLAGGDSGAAVRAAATRGVAILITIVLMVFLLGHGPRMIRGLLRQVPEDRRRDVSTALLHAYRRAWGYTVAMLVKAVAVGLITYALGHSLDLPASSVLAAVVGATSLVPYLGIALGGLAVVLLAAGVHGGSQALVATVAIIALQGADAAVTARVIQSRTMRVGPAISLAVVLIGTSAYGVGGAAVALCFAVFGVAVAQEGLPDLEPGVASAERTLP